jgi:hypothetical protein
MELIVPAWEGREGKGREGKGSEVTTYDRWFQLH